ncbi:MAG: metal ABC transporter permease [Proteobacteria bacterium]|nr:MAG: metal ABC transporter permease [Pseudomonadota bacterium]
MLEFAFMQRALVAAVWIGVVCGALGFFVVLRRLAFIGVGISHSAIGGVALGIVLGLSPLATGAAFAVAVALAIAAVGRRGRLAEDTVIGVFFSGSMALGVVLFSLQRGYQQDLFGYLFGNVLAVSSAELALLGAAGAAVLAALAFAFRPLFFASFDEEVARAYGHPVDALGAGLLVLLAGTVVIGVRLVGVILVEALLVIPAATAALWAGHYRGQLALSIAFGAGAGAAGLALAYRFDLAAGGTIVLVLVAAFGLSLALRRR